MRAGPSGMNTVTVARGGRAGRLPRPVAAGRRLRRAAPQPGLAPTCARSPRGHRLHGAAHRAPRADAAARLRRAPPRRRRRRHDHRKPQPAGRQRSQGLSRRTRRSGRCGRPDRPAGRSRDRGRDREVGTVPRCPSASRTLLLAGALAEPYLTRSPATAARSSALAYTPLHGVGLGLIGPALRRDGLRRTGRGRRAGRTRPGLPDRALPQPRGHRERSTGSSPSSATPAPTSGIASDPDADRCAAVVGDRVLSGDEIGVLARRRGAAPDDPVRWRRRSSRPRCCRAWPAGPGCPATSR